MLCLCARAWLCVLCELYCVTLCGVSCVVVCFVFVCAFRSYHIKCVFVCFGDSSCDVVGHAVCACV